MKRNINRMLEVLLAVAMASAAGSAVANDETAPSPFARQGKAVEIETLAEHRGGAIDQQINDQKLVSTVAGNSATDVVSGANVISDGAFGHVQGIPLVVQNSGSNVSIQNATILNITVK